MHNILEKVRQRDHYTVEADARPSIWPKATAQAQAASATSGHVGSEITTAGEAIERQLAGTIVTCLPIPKSLWRRLPTINVIERCFVEVRRRTRPMVDFVNVKRSSRDLTWNGKLAPSRFLHTNRAKSIVGQS